MHFGYFYYVHRRRVSQCLWVKCDKNTKDCQENVEPGHHIGFFGPNILSKFMFSESVFDCDSPFCQFAKGYNGSYFKVFNISHMLLLLVTANISR